MICRPDIVLLTGYKCEAPRDALKHAGSRWDMAGHVVLDLAGGRLSRPRNGDYSE